MNKEWSEKNKLMQSLMKKGTFDEGIIELISLRDALMDEILSWKKVLTPSDYYAMPYMNADGYHSKTVAYSLWHIFRIEDIVVNTLINNRTEVLFSGDFVKKTRSPIITTGNELVKEQIADFSKQLDIDALFEYIQVVKAATDQWLRSIDFASLKRRFDDDDKKRVIELEVVSGDELAFWLIDYWCSKDVKGLIFMPMSRHWILHVEAALRIINKCEHKQ